MTTTTQRLNRVEDAYGISLSSGAALAIARMTMGG